MRGNNPLTAVKKFLKKNKKFRIEKTYMKNRSLAMLTADF